MRSWGNAFCRCFDLRAEENDELRCYDDQDQREGICCCICRSYVFCLCNADERTKRGSGGHTAGDGAEVVEKRELQNVLREEETDDHGNDGDDYTVEEVYCFELRDKFCAAGDTCADEEEHQAEFTENLERACFGHDGDLSDAGEVTEDESHEQTTTGGGEREAAKFDGADENAENGSESEGHEAEFIHVHKLAGVFLFVSSGNGGDLCAFFVHICLGHLGDELNEKNNADNTEEVSNAVTYGNEGSKTFGNGVFRCGECRSRGERTGKDTNEHRGEFCVVKIGEESANEDATNGRKRTGEDDNDTDENVRFEVFLQIAEELGACNETNGGYEEDQTEGLHDAERFICESGSFKSVEIQSIAKRLIEEYAKNERDNENAAGAEINTLDGDSAEDITNCRDCKDAKHEEGNTAKCIDRHNVSPFFVYLFLPINYSNLFS